MFHTDSVEASLSFYRKYNHQKLRKQNMRHEWDVVDLDHVQKRALLLTLSNWLESAFGEGSHRLRYAILSIQAGDSAHPL